MIRFPAARPVVDDAEREQVLRVLESGQITQGSRTALFEEALADFLKVKHVVACASGTAALHLALSALGIRTGDEVLVPDLTYIATANAVTYTGARPVFVDVDVNRWGINLNDARKALTNRTAAIIPVHLYGVPCDMDQIRDFASRHKLHVVEDAAEGLGGNWKGKPLGTFGLGTFSFYGNKILTTGEGGAVATDDLAMARKLRLFRGQGQGDTKFRHDVIGFNYRMSDLHAAIGLGQLEHLEADLAHRMELFKEYRRRLGVAVRIPDHTGIAPWSFTCLLTSSGRNDVMKKLREQGIETRPMFVPLHEQPCYAGSYGHFPVATAMSRFGISLPTYVDMTLEDVDLVASTLLHALDQRDY